MANETKQQFESDDSAVLVRIMGRDILGSKKLLSGLTNITGVSWSFANGICKVLGLDKNLLINDLSDEQISYIEDFISNPSLPSFMLNRQKDFDDGLNKHISSEDIKLRKEFDIKRLKKIKSYKGVRHSLGQPVRGQRTKSHFRTNRKKSGAVGVKKKG